MMVGKTLKLDLWWLVVPGFNLLSQFPLKYHGC